MSNPQLPTKHLSIRVPWHDNGWNGTVCSNPLANTSCLVLDRISKRRDDDFEKQHAGKLWKEIESQKVGCYAGENGAFMAPFEYHFRKKHPYDEQHFDPAYMKVSEYSAVSIPFRWMNRRHIKMMPNDNQNEKSHFDPINWYGIPFNRDIERSSGKNIKWIEHPENQRLMLDTFSSAIKANESLVFFYAKDVPLTTDPRRVIVGIGLVKFIGGLKQYLPIYQDRLSSYAWERNIGHTIRPDDVRGYTGGFLLPFEEILELTRNNSTINPERYVVFTPEEAWDSFSYASEHVSHDIAISVLLECRGVFERLTNDKIDISGRWNLRINWIDEQLNRLWKMRGPYPGMGSVLTAFGIENGTLIAYEINKIQQESATEYSQDPWDIFEQALDNPKLIPSGRRHLGRHQKELWQATTDTDRKRYKLLSRFSISREQVSKYIDRAQSDAIMANPYLLYEQDRFETDGISLRTIDRGLYPDTIIQEKYPLPEPANMEGPTDPRRVRAFCVYYLEEAAKVDGHSLMSRDLLMGRLRETDITTTPLIVNDVVLDLAERYFDEAIKILQLEEDKFYQLLHISECVAQIQRLKRKLERSRPHEGHHDWQRLLDEEFGEKTGSPEEQQLETLSRKEKSVVLEKLYRARFSVLVGGAGTGKTTVLKVLCNSADDIKGSVLLLAPTGKARVRMESEIGVTRAQTISQFLFKRGLYDGAKDRYSLAERGRRFDEIPNTVIVDECSMLTEPQLASLLSVVNRAQRIILVGDPQQLPPIGTGRPFVDIAEYIKESHSDAHCELAISRRQQGESRDDLALANWFGSGIIPAGEDDIWEKIASGESSHIQAIKWDEPHELQSILFDSIREYLVGLEFSVDSQTENEFDRFAYSLGGTKYEKSPFPFFNRGYVGDRVESWQILSPVRGETYGVKAINRAIQHHFQRRVRQHLTHTNRNRRKFPPPIGNEELLYGDKVINVVNHWRDNSSDTPGGTQYAVYPTGGLEYVANGEIGLVIGHRRTRNRDWTPEDLEVEFASQTGYSYKYESWEFSEHGTPPLQLAYALTIHKAQGSEFGVVFLVLPKASPVLSRELLYTALTRQKDRIILLHQGDFTELQSFTNPLHSSILRRTTNLFRTPNMQEVQLDDTGEPVYMEQGLIHTTSSGVRVRSKSELILAETFDSQGLEWEYERRFDGRYPDFTIEDHDLGRTVYWEHLGMLHVPHYRQKWESKRQWYIDRAILPYEDDDGTSDILVTTEDDENGGFDSFRLRQILSNVFDLD